MGGIVGSTHAGGKYALTSKPFLKEGSDRIMEMGSQTIKLWLNNSPGSNYPYNSNWGQYLLGVSSVTDLIQTPYYKEALDLPFATVVLMTTEFVYPNWKNGMNTTETNLVRAELQELTEYLLTEYRGSGKTFILANWESDNNLNFDVVPSTSWPTYIQGMIDWTNARMDGIIAGRAAAGMDGVAVFGAFEVNQIPVHKSFDWPVAIDVVVPYTYCDIYSYSNWGTKVPGEEWQIIDNLDYIASKCPPSAFFGERNVYLGEWGAYEISYMDPLYPELPEDTRVHDADSDAQQRDVVMTNLNYALRWGIPYALYWQVYGNGLRTGVSVPLGQMATEEQLKGVWLIRPPSTLLGLPYSYTSTWGSLAELMTTNRLFDDLASAGGMETASPGLRLTSSQQDWALGDVNRIAPATGGAESQVSYLTGEALDDFHIKVFATNPATLADKLALEVSVDGTAWEVVPFSVEFIRSFEGAPISRAYLWPAAPIPAAQRHFRIRWINPAGDFPQLGDVALFTGDIATIEDAELDFAAVDMSSGNWESALSGPDGLVPVLRRSDSAAGWIIHRANAIRTIRHSVLSSGATPPGIAYSVSFDGSLWTSIGGQVVESTSIGSGWTRKIWEPLGVPAGTRYIRLEVEPSDPVDALLETYSMQYSPRAISVDSDNDGWLDLEESWLGTDPANPSDRFEVDTIGFDSAGLHLGFKSVTGTRYRVQRLTDSTGLQWNDWVTVEADAPTTSLTDPDAAGLPLVLYRVGLAPW